MVNTITVLQTTGRLKACKVVSRLSDGSILVKPSDWAKNYKLSSLTASNIHELAECIDGLFNNQIVIRGIPETDVDITSLMQRVGRNDNPELTPNQNPFIDSLSNWLMIDIDKFEALNGHDIRNKPVACIENLISLLPKQFHDVTCYWQFSGSSGISYIDQPNKLPERLSAHLWFWMTTPVNTMVLRQFAKAHNTLVPDLIDPSIYKVVQPHFVSSPIFENPLHDPLNLRSGIIQRDKDEVDIDVLAYIAEHPISKLSSGITTKSDTTKGPDPYAQTVGYDGYLQGLGDHETGEGFNDPLTSAIMSFVQTQKIYPADQRIAGLKDDLKTRIDAANISPSRLVSELDRYKSDKWLDSSINGAIAKAQHDQPVNSHILNTRPLPFDEAVSELNNAIAKFSEDVVKYSEAVMEGTKNLLPPALALKAAAGIGKTRSIIKQLISDGGLRGSIDYYVPSHALAEEVVKDLREELKVDLKGLNIPKIDTVRFIRGMDRDDDSGNPLCTQHADVSKALALGISVQKDVCGPCVDRFICGYQKQFNRITLPDTPPELLAQGLDLEDVLEIPAVVNVMAHNYLFLHTPLYARNLKSNNRFNQATSNLAIVDEKFWDKGFTTAKLNPNKLASQNNEVSKVISEGLNAKLPLLKYLNDSGITEFDLKREAAKLKPTSASAASNRDLRTLYYVLAGEVELGCHEDSRCVFLSKEKDKDGNEKPIIQVLKRNELTIPPEIPMIFLDADLSKPVIDLYRENCQLKEISAKRESTVLQVKDLSFGTRYQKDHPQELDNVRQLIEKVAKTGKTLVVTTKKLRRKLMGVKLSDLPSFSPLGEADIAHFSNLRGLNAFEDYVNVVIVGRQQLSWRDVENQAKALWWDDREPFTKLEVSEDNQHYWVNQTQGIRMKDADPVIIGMKGHPDERVRIINEQTCNAESTQAIDRLRLVRNKGDKKQAKVIILSNAPLDITVDHLFTWDMYCEMATFESEADDIGFIPLKANHLLDIFTCIKSKKTAERRSVAIAKDFEVYEALGLFSNYTKQIKYREAGSKSRYSTALCSVGASNTAMIDLFTERAGIEIEIKPTVSESTDPQTSGLGI